MIEAIKMPEIVVITKPPEKGKTPEKGGGNGSDKTISDLIKDLLEGQEKTKREVVEEVLISNEVRKNRETTSSWAEKITNIIAQVKNPARGSEVVKIPAIVREVITKVPVQEINSITSPLLYTFLEAAANPVINWESAADVKKVVDDIFRLRGLDTSMARIILRPLHDTLLAKGESEAVLKDLKDFLNPQVKTKEQQDDEIRQMNETVEKVYQTIYYFPVSEQINSKIEAQFQTEYAEKIANGSMTPTMQDQVRKQLRADAASHLHVQVAEKYNAMHGARTPAERAIKRAEYMALISSLQYAGEISEATLRELKDIPDKMKDYFDKVDKETFSGREFIDQLQHISAMSLTDEQTALLSSMGSVDTFEQHILNAKRDGVSRFINAKGEMNWKAFYGEIKEIFDEILSVADSKPNQFHQEAFNPMYEGHLYQILLKQIDRLGVQLQGKKSKLALLEVQYDDIGSTPTTFKEALPNQPRTQTRVWQTNKTEFGNAMQTLLVNRMTNLRMIREHLHNIQAIVNLGLGWEQLSQYADRLGNAKIDWYTHEDPDLGKALQLYMTSLQDEVSANHGVMRTDFGHTDDLSNLSITGRRALWQMMAHLKKSHPEYKNKGDTWIMKKARQKLSTATAITQGVSGDFWTTLLTARMPMGYSVDKEGNLGVRTAYTGTESAGYEKMVTALDLDLTLERFGLPKYYNAFRWVFQSRNLDESPDPYSKEGFFLGHHGNAYEVGKKINHAFFGGPDEVLMAFDEKHITFYENMRTKCVGLMHRGGWRMVNWEAHWIPRGSETPVSSPEGHTSLDFAKTLGEMQRIGSYLVRQFLDSVALNKGLFAITNMTADEVQLFCGLNKPGSALSEDEIKKYFSKQALYEHVLFGQIERVRPSHYLRLERRRFTPGKTKTSEAEKLIQDELVDYLKDKLKGRYFGSIIEDDIFKMYVSALSLAEKATWWENREKKRTDYEFTIDDIIRHETEIKDFFRLSKINSGEKPVSGQKISIGETEQEAFEILKGFFGTLRVSIARERGKYGSDYKSKETLRQRFARFLLVDTPGNEHNAYANSAMGDIVHRLVSDDFDLSEFFFSAGGDRATARYMGETHLVAKEMIPALRNIIDNGVSGFVKGTYKDIHDVEKAVEKLFVEDIKKIHSAISMMDKAQADRYVVQLAVFITQLIGKDRQFRSKGLGSAFESWVKRIDPTTAASMMQDFFPSKLDYPSTSLDGDMVHAFGHAFMKACNISPQEEIADKYEQAKLFGKIPLWKRRVNKGEEWVRGDLKLLGHTFKGKGFWKKHIKHGDGHLTTFETFEKGAGVTLKAKWIETYGPTLGWVMLLIMFMMIKAAFDKNKKK